MIDAGNAVPITLPRQVLRVGTSFLKSRTTALLLFNVAFIVAVAAYNPDFVAPDNLRVIAENMALEAIVMVGAVFLLAAGRFDLSVDGSATVSGVVAGLVLTNTGLPWAIGLLAGLGVGLAIGIANGILIEVGGLDPLMTTLGMWWLSVGIALGATQGYSPYGFPEGFSRLGQARVGGMLVFVWYAVAIVAVGAVVLAFTRFGWQTYATGGDREASRLNGVKVVRIGIVLYAASGLLAGIAGTIFAARLGTATSQAFDGLALNVIAAAVIGGAALGGGRGSVVGGLLGLLLLNMLGNAAIFVGLSPYWQKAISDVVLLVAVAADIVGRRRSTRRATQRLRVTDPSEEGESV